MRRTGWRITCWRCRAPHARAGSGLLVDHAACMASAQPGCAARVRSPGVWRSTRARGCGCAAHQRPVCLWQYRPPDADVLLRLPSRSHVHTSFVTCRGSKRTDLHFPARHWPPLSAHLLLLRAACFLQGGQAFLRLRRKCPFVSCCAILWACLPLLLCAVCCAQGGFSDGSVDVPMLLSPVQFEGASLHRPLVRVRARSCGGVRARAHMGAQGFPCRTQAPMHCCAWPLNGGCRQSLGINRWSALTLQSPDC